MKAIKFRAWTNYSKVMFYPDVDDGWELAKGVLNPLPNTILMQYTGLKDKNGKGIYEGDIMLGGVVTYFKEWTGFKLVTKSGRYNIFEGDEIVGNIYENPELLTK